MERELAHAQVRVQHERGQVRAQPNGLEELAREDLLPVALGIRHEPQKLARVGQFAAQPRITGQRAGFDRPAACLVEVGSLPMHHSPGQQRPSALGGGGRLTALEGQNALVLRHRLRGRRDPQLLPQQRAQPVELANGAGAVSGLQPFSHDLAMRHLAERLCAGSQPQPRG